MRKIGWVLGLLLLGHVGWGQSLAGAWYHIYQDGLIEMAIDRDSIRIRRAYMDFTRRDQSTAASPIDRTVPMDDRQLLVIRQGIDTTLYSALTLFDFVPGKQFREAWNALDTMANSPFTLVQLHEQDRRKLFGHVYFSARYIDALKRLRPIDEMTKPEFDRFFAVYAGKIRQATRELEAYDPDFGYNFALQLDAYNFSLTTEALYEQGFNPLQDEAARQALYLRFYSEKQVRKKIEGILRK